MEKLSLRNLQKNRHTRHYFQWGRTKSTAWLPQSVCFSRNATLTPKAGFQSSIGSQSWELDKRGVKSMNAQTELRVPALEITQRPGRVFYSFAVDGKLLASFTTISRIRRDASEALIGYQRPEVLSHINEIREYLESSNPLLPNAIVIAFNDRVTFLPGETAPGGFTRFGTLVIPTSSLQSDEDKPGFIVDGQQRVAAIRDAEITEFPICATAFIAANESEQREQFILVNSTKPLPKGLIYEL